MQFPANCRAYAVIREADKEGAVTVCGGGSRARTVYVSKLNHVELQMVTDINNVANNYVFLFLYEGLLQLSKTVFSAVGSVAVAASQTMSQSIKLLIARHTSSRAGLATEKS